MTEQSPDGAHERVTLKTIAEKTGLSLSTVSLSLRGGATLKAETRDRVAAAAAELGYVPDRAGVRLRTGKTNVLTLVLGGGEDSVDFARQMIQGIGRALVGTRYHLNVAPEFSAEPTLETVRYILVNRAADGVVITHTTPDDERVRFLTERGFPFVSHGRTGFSAPHAFVDFHSEVFAQKAVERLAQKGRRRLLLMIGDDRTTNYANITRAFRKAAAKAGVSAEVLDTRPAQGDPARIRDLARDLAGRADAPDGIICDSEMRAIALLGGLIASGQFPSRAIDVIYKQTSGIVPTLFPDLDSIEENVTAAGDELTRLLLRRIAGEPPQDLQRLAEPVLHWRSG